MAKVTDAPEGTTRCVCMFNRYTLVVITPNGDRVPCSGATMLSYPQARVTVGGWGLEEVLITTTNIIK